MATLSERDAQQAAAAAHALTTALLPALLEQADGAEMIDVQAWKDAGVPELLRTTRRRIDQALGRLES